MLWVYQVTVLQCGRPYQYRYPATISRRGRLASGGVPIAGWGVKTAAASWEMLYFVLKPFANPGA